jgi:hypothetical protein
MNLHERCTLALNQYEDDSGREGDDAMMALDGLHQIDHIEPQIVEVLSHRYGDGNIYLPSGSSKQLWARAIALGYISEDGYVTRKGRELLAQYQRT